MTEEEARKKLCPKLLHLNGACIATDCMAWRSDKHKTAVTRLGEKTMRIIETGHCGLAGEE